MKKSIYVIGIAAMGLMASCSSDSDYQAVAESTINVLSAQTMLGPSDSEGAVTVDCTPMKAYTDEPSWLSTSIEGSTVKLAAIANDSRQSRNAKLVIKKTENDSVVINVAQYGLVLEMNNADMIYSNDQPVEFTKTYRSNTDMKVISAPEWANASVDTNSKELKVSLSENTTGHLRADYIKYQVAAVTDSFIVKQFDFDKDIAGEYVFAYYDFNEDTKLELHTVRATLSRTELAIPEMGLVFPVSINEKTGSVETRSSQYLGKFGKYYIYDTFLDTEGHAYMGSESGLLSATFKYSEQYHTYGFFGGTAYTINKKTGNFLAMILQVFKAKSASESNYLTDFCWMVQPYIMSVPKTETTSVKRQAPALARQLAPSTSSFATKFSAWQSYRKSSIIK